MQREREAEWGMAGRTAMPSRGCQAASAPRGAGKGREGWGSNDREV